MENYNTHVIRENIQHFVVIHILLNIFNKFIHYLKNLKQNFFNIIQIQVVYT